MIAGIFHQGSGLGNQLHRYVMTRVLAESKGYTWGMINPQNFKGASFMNLDMGVPIELDENGDIRGVGHHTRRFNEKKVLENGVDVRGYDPEVNFIQDYTIIDGEFQDERYFERYIRDIREWLKVEPVELGMHVGVINFRGGEYTGFGDLFLPKQYWDDAIGLMLNKHQVHTYQVHTDDPASAEQFFPMSSPIRDIGLNWRSVRYASFLILSNSSFGILPALLNENVEEVIAPRYWARRNIGIWALPQNFYKKFTYI